MPLLTLMRGIERGLASHLTMESQSWHRETLAIDVLDTCTYFQLLRSTLSIIKRTNTPTSKEPIPHS